TPRALRAQIVSPGARPGIAKGGTSWVTSRHAHWCWSRRRYRVAGATLFRRSTCGRDLPPTLFPSAACMPLEQGHARGVSETVQRKGFAREVDLYLAEELRLQLGLGLDVHAHRGHHSVHRVVRGRATLPPRRSGIRIL